MANNLFDYEENFDAENFAGQHLTPERLNTIYESIQSAINEYRNNYANLRFKHSARTEANIIHDLIVECVKEKFEQDLHSYHVTKNGLFLLGVDNGAILIRFKKMDSKKRVSNIPTNQSYRFNNQFALFGPSININAGYHINGLDTEIYVACPKNNKKNYWAWPITGMPLQFVPAIHTEDLTASAGRQLIPRRKELESDVANE